MYKLDYIAGIELKASKIDYSEYGNLDDLYDKNPQLYITYNIHDTTLLEQLEDKLHLIDIQLSIAYDSGCNYLDAFATVRPWDCAIHNYLMDQKIVVPQSKYQDYHEQIEGAYVKVPIPGRHKWVVSIDYKSLYPSLAQQCNISPETIITTIPNISVEFLFNRKLDGTKLAAKLLQENVSLCATGCIFNNSVEGFIPALMHKVYNERVVVRKKLAKAEKELQKAKEAGLDTLKLEQEVSALNSSQHSKKIRINSLYGALASAYFRWFDTRLAESITKTGQLVLHWTERGINEFLNKICGTEGIEFVVYGDTDSCYIELNEWVTRFVKNTDPTIIVDKIDEFCKKKLEPEIVRLNQELKEYLNHYRLVLDANREKIASSAFWTAKKRYGMSVWDSEGVRYTEPELKIMGLESVKNSTPRITRPLIKEAIRTILLKDEADLHKYIDDIQADYKTRPFHEIAYTKNTSGLAKYSSESTIYAKGCPINVRAALVYNSLIKKHNLGHKYQLIGEGDKIKFCYLTMPNPAGSSVIGAPDELPPEFGLEAYLDYNLQFEKTFMAPVKAMSDAVTWRIAEIPELEDLFEY